MDLGRRYINLESRKIAVCPLPVPCAFPPPPCIQAGRKAALHAVCVDVRLGVGRQMWCVRHLQSFCLRHSHLITWGALNQSTEIDYNEEMFNAFYYMFQIWDVLFSPHPEPNGLFLNTKQCLSKQELTYLNFSREICLPLSVIQSTNIYGFLTIYQTLLHIGDTIVSKFDMHASSCLFFYVIVVRN